MYNSMAFGSVYHGGGMSLPKGTSSHLDPLMKDLGYVFDDIARLDQALTHRSQATQHNERLEFLGDAVVGLVVSSYLIQHQPHLGEGELTRWRSQLVNTEYLASVATRFRLGNYLSNQIDKRRSGRQGAISKRMLANTMEALIGALYRDCQDWLTCQRHVTRWLDLDEKAAHAPKILMDSKTELQQWCQARKLELPIYEDGPSHNGTEPFQVQCKVSFSPHHLPCTVGHGQGQTKRAAQKEAAQDCLSQLQQTPPSLHLDSKENMT